MTRFIRTPVTNDNSIEYESEYEYRFAEYEYVFGNARSVTIPKG